MDEFDEIFEPCDPENDPILKAPALKKEKRRHWRARFIQVPMAWAQKLAASTSPCAFKAALCIVAADWHERKRQEDGFKPKDEAGFPLSNEALSLFGVRRRWKRSALEELQRLGLVRITWRRYKNPLVEIRLGRDDYT
jgi:hypothetical protein